ncbi:MAG: TatD family hydrolase, partial [Acidobacteriota bacterium]
MTAAGPWTDSHAHLAMEDFGPDLPEVVERARAAGVGQVLVVGTSPEDWAPSARTAARFGFRATAGLHPHEARRWGESRDLLREALRHPLVAAVGEVGLDYHYDLSPRGDQRVAFEEQVALALEEDLPVVVHSREAFEDTLAILKGAGPALRGVLHCFTYGAAEAEAFLDLDLFLSFSGIATFPKAPGVREAARRTPLRRLLVETD